LESIRVAANAAVTTVRGRQSRMKAVAASRATVRSRRREAIEGWVAATEEERRAVVSHGKSLGVRTSTKWVETPSTSGALTAGLGESGRGLDQGEAERVCGLQLAACAVRETFLFWETTWSIRYL
jgi:hypothetical protein